MAEYKQIKTRIWQDNWFLSLSIEEKLLWFFLLTNEYSHISGLYELPKPLISPLVGIKNWNEILLKFVKDKKILYKNGWIYIINKSKHQPISQNVKDNVNISIKKYLTENKEILAKINKPLTSPLQAPCQTLPEREVEVEVEVECEDEDEVLRAEPAEEIIPNLLKDKNKHIQIIGLWAKAKKITFTGKEHQQSFIRRNLRAAQNLAPYDINRIIEVMAYLIKYADFKSTLESVGKYIDEDLSALNIKNQTIDLSNL